MDNEFHKLVNDILIDCKCTGCGGNVCDTECIFCGSKLSPDKEKRKN